MWEDNFGNNAFFLWDYVTGAHDAIWEAVKVHDIIYWLTYIVCMRGKDIMWCVIDQEYEESL